MVIRRFARCSDPLPVRRECGIAHRRTGGVLLVVLGVIVAMGVVVTLLASYALERALLAETRGAETRTGAGDRLAGAIEASMAVVGVFEEVAGGLHSPAEGWGDPAELLAGWPAALAGIDVEVVDESSRPGLSLLGERELKILLEEFGLRRGTATEMADLLLDWMDEDDDQRIQGRENRGRISDRDPWVANRPPVSWEEVWSIPEWREQAFDSDGNMEEWARRFSSWFTLEHEEPANINTVDSDLVEWLAEARLISSPNWLDQRSGFDNQPGTADDRILTELPGGDEGLGALFSTESRVLRIRASERVGERRVWKEAWVARSDGDDREGRNGRDNPNNPGIRNPASGSQQEGDGFSPWGGWEILEVRGGLSE